MSGRQCAGAASPPPRGARHFLVGPAARGGARPRPAPHRPPARPCPGRAGMEKLRRVLAGQDDEEQGLTAQVRPGGSPLSLPLPGAGRWSLPAPAPSRCPWLGRCRVPRAAFPRPRPAHTHSPLPGACPTGAEMGRQRRDQGLRRAPRDEGCGQQALPGGWVSASSCCVKLLAVLVAWGPLVSTGFSCA